MSRYVALDGPDGCGKSSQAAALVAWLQADGHDVVHVREPGSTPVGEGLRQLLLSPATGRLRGITEVLLFSAARAELVERVIAPARQRGATVVAERSFLSTAVYQLTAGQVADVDAGGIDLQWFRDLTRRVHGACLPDTIALLDVPVDVAAQRRRGRTEDRIEARGLDYQQSVRNGFLAVAASEPRALVVDASRSFDEVQVTLRQLFAGER